MRLWLIALLFISCNYTPRKEASINEIFPVKPDTVKTAPQPVASKPELFETAYFPGTQANLDTLPVSFYAVDIGKIKIETGKIIASDATMLITQHATPFIHNFPVGQFPVQLAIARINGDERVAFSRILFSDSAVAKWEFALHEGQQPIPLDSKEQYGYGVDSGLGLFADSIASKAFGELDNKNNDTWTTVFVNGMNTPPNPSWQYLLYDVDNHNLASFSTGWGDGFYSTYVGYDSKGNICRLLTDFELVDWWKK